jgi:ribonuclease HI
LISSKGDQLLFMIRLHFRMTNNVAEYETLIIGLRIVAEFRVQRLYIHSDFELIINQVKGELNCHSCHMAAYHQEVRKIEEMFDGFELYHILWHDNEEVDAFAWLRSSRKQLPSSVFVHYLIKSSIQLNEGNLAPAPGTAPGKGGRRQPLILIGDLARAN